MLDATLADIYEQDGVVSTRVLSTEEARRHRIAFERGEDELGPLHYIHKVHTVMTSASAILTHSAVLDIVEQLIGPDILLYNSTYIVKEPDAPAFVAWHQDLTYWGLSDDDAQVSVWFALAPATVESGCMSMLPGSHKAGRAPHVADASDERNLLSLGQRIEGVDETRSKPYPLEPGEASFHHGWTIHASGPNTSADRRIGLNAQYVAPHNRQETVSPTALLVRGTDRFGHFGPEVPAEVDFDPAAVARWRELDAVMNDSFQTTDDGR